MCVRGIVPSQESKRSCICVLGVSIFASVSTVTGLDFGTVVFFVFHFISTLNNQL